MKVVRVFAACPFSKQVADIFKYLNYYNLQFEVNFLPSLISLRSMAVLVGRAKGEGKDTCRLEFDISWCQGICNIPL